MQLNYHPFSVESPPLYARWPLGVAVLLSLLGYAAHLIFLPLDTGLPFATFHPAIVLSYYFLGLRAGLVTLTLSALIAYFAFIPPYYDFGLSKYGNVGLGFFLFTNLLIGFIVNKLHFNEIRLKLLLEDQTDVICRFTPDGVLLYANKAYLDLFGFKNDHKQSLTWKPVVYKDDVAMVNKRIQEVSFETPIVIIENRIYDHAQNVRWFQFINHGIFNANKKLIEIQSVGRETTETKKQQDSLNYIAHHDTLTDLPNRLLFHDRLKQAIVLAKRRNSNVAVCYLDLDGFKQINDQYGHSAGDEVLITTSQRLLEVVRESDTVSRMGGDEFMVIINDYNDDVDHKLVIDRMIRKVSQPIVLNNNETVYVTASVGMSQYQKDAIEPSHLIQLADERMYIAKASGRNQLVSASRTLID